MCLRKEQGGRRYPNSLLMELSTGYFPSVPVGTSTVICNLKESLIDAFMNS
jgi:hypothetical protein